MINLVREPPPVTPLREIRITNDGVTKDPVLIIRPDRHAHWRVKIHTDTLGWAIYLTEHSLDALIESLHILREQVTKK